MALNLSLIVDKKSVSKGDSVNVSWTSDLPDSLVLIIDDGDTVQRVQVSDSGSRMCWTNRATKDLVFTLVATVGTRKESVNAKVKGNGTGSSSQSASGNSVGKFQLWKEKMQARFAVVRAQFQYTWASMKTWQRILWTVLWALPFILLAILIIK